MSHRRACVPPALNAQPPERSRYIRCSECQKVFPPEGIIFDALARREFCDCDQGRLSSPAQPRACCGAFLHTGFWHAIDCPEAPSLEEEE